MQGNLGVMLLREVDHLAREKFLDKEAVFSSLEKALRDVFLGAYGQENDIFVSINRKDGAIQAYRCRRIVDSVEDPFKEIDIASALKAEPMASLGDIFKEEVPFIPTTRTAAQNVKHTLMRSIREMEKEAQYLEFRERVGQIITGSVKRIERGNLIIDLGRAEGVILRSDLIPRENFQVNDRIKAYIYNVKNDSTDFQIFLSRTHSKFLEKLFAQEVPEIYDGLIEIKAVARDPGSRAKVAIYSRDMGRERSFDPVGACVGIRGSRVNAVGQELRGEKIDVVLWSQELPTFVVNALTPAEVVKVIIEGDKPNSLTAVVPDHQQSIAIGRRAQNVRLAHQLTGASISIITESQEIALSTKNRQETVSLFMDRLGVDELMALFLVSEGFESIQDLNETSENEMALLEGFTLEIAKELKSRAVEAFQEDQDALKEAFLSSGGNQNLLEIGVPLELLGVLVRNGVVSVSEFSDLSSAELMDIVENEDIVKMKKFSLEDASALIMKARSCLHTEGSL